VLVLDMIEIIPSLGKYKYDTWRILPVKCYIDNYVRFRSCIRNINSDKLREFQWTKPLTFSHSIKPMDVDDWWKTVEKKMQVVQCNNKEKVLFTAHQLVGPVADWWDAYVGAHEEPETMNWKEFRNSFRTHHVPLGVMKLKKKEFEDLKQGSMTVSEYVTRFTQLSHYAPNNVDTDEKKQD
jgi:hypothetical protein